MKIFCVGLFLLFSSIAYSQSPCRGSDSLNYGGQWYNTVQIGNQCWLKENLNIGIMKPAIKDQVNNDTIEKFCYNNDPVMCDTYGGLYQWREALQYTQKQGARGICPIGWHIPLIEEFDALLTTVNHSGNALLKIGQGGGTNTSGFSGLLSGYNEYTAFGYIAINANFWSCYSFYQPPLNGEYLELWNDNDVISGRHYFADFGLSVRCIKDNSLLLQSPYGGESWLVGANHKISWGGDLIDKKIRIEYSTDNGISWLIIIDSTPANNGEFNWTIPNTASMNCKIRITDLNDLNSISISENVFTIYKYCSIGSTIEHGGKIYNTFMIGNKCWFKENVDIGTIIPGSKEPAPNGLIEKYCYNDDTANCTIYGGLYTFSEMNEAGFCPTFWHIEGLSYPAQQNLFDGNSLKAIGQGKDFGTGTNTSGFSVLLAGQRNGDGTFTNLGNLAWFPYNYYLFPYKINAHFLDSISSFIGITDDFLPKMGGNARCVRDDIGPLLLKSPYGGENWQVASTQKISWTLSNVINIRIDYSTDSGTNWINIIPSTPTTAGSYNWKIPNTPSKNCKVKISSTDHPDTNSISNLFQIYRFNINPCPGIPTVDYGGQTYHTIIIGDQCWLKQNLNIGTMINVTQDPSDNAIIEKHCYKNDTNYCAIYGGLYEWNEAMHYDSAKGAKGICPTGWHIPTFNEFSILGNYVGNNGNDLKEVGQGDGNGAGTNATGFSGLLAGFSYHGVFNSFGDVAQYWNSTSYDSTNAYKFGFYSLDTNLLVSFRFKDSGFSIRCINDLTVSDLPVELISFFASIFNNNVRLNWYTATEINTSSFEIEKKTINNGSWQKIASVRASGNSISPRHYSYVDNDVIAGKYSYRLKMVDFDGSFKYSKIVNVEIAPPAKFELSNAYPNPWNPTTTIRYQVPTNILVTIKVFNALGKEVATLVNEIKPAGNYEVTFNGKGLASGTYYYQMKAGNFISTKKITLIK